jgi:prepilin peptidase CpaA
MAAVGAWVGYDQVGIFLMVSALAGGLLAAGYMLVHKQIFETLRNTVELLRHHRTAGIEPHPVLNVQQAGTLRLPYGVAIAIGTFYCVGNAFWWR